MDRAIRPISARMGGVEIVVSAAARRGIRRKVRQASVVVGWVSGILALTCAAVAVLQSVLLWPVLVCGGIAGFVVWRGTNHVKEHARRDRNED